MKKTSSSSDNSPTPDSGAIASLWRPSWWHWLISALSGTVEIEEQTALLKHLNEEARKQREEEQKRYEEKKKADEQTLKALREQNAKLAELESKLKEISQS